jgi:hypothetical protein
MKCISDLFRSAIPFLIVIFTFSAKGQYSNPNYEFRGVWVASVENIDWPKSKKLSVEEQKASFIELLNMHQRNGMNAILMQIRPAGDALYPSKLEPWSEYLTGMQGLAPDPYYDPLTFMITETHKRGMEFHAWLQADQDIFYNTEGIYMFDGTISYLVLNQNNVARYWLRRARPSIEGKAFEFLNYFINIDFGFNNPTLYDAFIDINYYRLLGLQVGRQMSLVGGIENYFDNFDYCQLVIIL